MHAGGEPKRRRQTSRPTVRRLAGLLSTFMQRNQAQSLQIMLECTWSSNISAFTVLDWQIKGTGKVLREKDPSRKKHFIRLTHHFLQQWTEDFKL